MTGYLNTDNEHIEHCLKCLPQYRGCGGVLAERIRAPSSSSGDFVQQSVGSNPGHDTCVPEQDT